MKCSSVKFRSGSGIAAAIAIVSLAAHAHHNSGMFDPAQIWIEGTVIRYEPVNPHVTMLLEETGADGQVRQWTIEGPHLGRIPEMHVEPKVGDTIQVCGFPLRTSVKLRVAGHDPYEMSDNFVHGHALVMADGHMEVFGSYGKLDHCIRPGDTAAQWLEFLNGSWRASRAWCNAMRTSAPSSAPQALVAEISARMELSC